MTRRLAPHWLALHRNLGLNPHHAGDWTLDEALMAEEWVDRQAREARVAAVRKRRR